MKKVIENKKALKLEENDYYQYQKYEKMKMSLNDVTLTKWRKASTRNSPSSKTRWRYHPRPTK